MPVIRPLVHQALRVVCTVTNTVYKLFSGITMIAMISGCTPTGVTHYQGMDCISCHGENGSSEEAREEKLLQSAGTLFTEQNASDLTLGAYLADFSVRLYKSGEEINYVQGEGDGNFYTKTIIEGSGFIAQVRDSDDVEIIASGATHGEDTMRCNQCHTANGLNGAPGRIYTNVTTTVTVTDVVANPVYETDVFPILESKCIGCHYNGSDKTYQVTDANSTYTHIMANFINTATPADSELLTKAIGGSNHSTIFSTTSTQYQNILTWIENGANP